MSTPELDAIRRQRSGLIVAMGLIIVAMAVGFGVVVYPWDLVRLPLVSYAVLLKELFPLTALLLLMVFFLADVTRQNAELAERERRLLEDTTGPGEPVQIEGVVRHALESVDPELSARGIRAEYAVEADARAMTRDARGLERLVTGLVRNAASAAGAEGGCIRIRLRTSDNGQVRLDVDDPAHGAAASVGLPTVMQEP